MRSAWLKALMNVISQLDEKELAAFIRSGDMERVLDRILNPDSLDRALYPLRYRMRREVEQSFKYAQLDLPSRGKVDGLVAVVFDHLSPSVVAAIRTMESTVFDRLAADIRDVVRATVERGLRDGRAPIAVARELRQVIGLAPNQVAYVDNLRAELESGRVADAARRKLLDRRFNLTKLAALGESERAARIDTIVQNYRKALIASNAKTNAQTLTHNAYKQGQRLAWQDAQAQGVIPDGSVLLRQWVHFDPQPDPRPEHIAMSKLPPVPADQPYTNGDTYAGESDPWNCKCIDRFFVERAA